MIHSRHSHIKLLNSMKLSSSRKRATSQSCETKVSEMQLEVLSHLLMTMFIARQLGLRVSLKLSKEAKKLLASQDQRP